MANIKVSEMTEATIFDDNDYAMIVQANQNKKITKGNMFDSVTDDITAINSNIGNLSNLTTTTKTDLVSSINEVNTNIINITGQILWVNPNPTNAIDSDLNITFSSNNYDLVLWLVRYSTSIAEIISTNSIKEYGAKISNILNDGETLRYREIIYNSETSYTIKGSPNGGALIPYCAIGYKTGLFN